MTLKNHQTQDSPERDIYSLYMLSSKELPELSLPSPYFICFMVWDTHGVAFEEMTKIAAWLLSKGCCYFCCWGDECGRLETAMDTVIVDQRGLVPITLTTAHQDETLEEGLAFAFNTAMPDDFFEKECGTTLVVVIGDESIYQRISNCL